MDVHHANCHRSEGYFSFSNSVLLHSKYYYSSSLHSFNLSTHVPPPPLPAEADYSFCVVMVPGHITTPLLPSPLFFVSHSFILLLLLGQSSPDVFLLDPDLTLPSSNKVSLKHFQSFHLIVIHGNRNNI